MRMFSEEAEGAEGEGRVPEAEGSSKLMEPSGAGRPSGTDACRHCPLPSSPSLSFPFPASQVSLSDATY